MKHFLSISLLTIFATGCSASSKTSSNDSADEAFDNSDPDEPGSTPDPDETPSDDVQAEVLFEVRGGAYDITLAPDGRVFVSIQEHGITVWDPVTDYPETYTERAGRSLESPGPTTQSCTPPPCTDKKVLSRD